MKLLLLGGLKLEGSSLTRPKPLLLLSYLSIMGPRDRRDLAELFFQGSQDPGQGLRVALSHLNREASGALRSSDKRLWTELPSDVDDLGHAFSRADYTTVKELYRGPFLEGFDLADLGEELEEWLYQMRERTAAKVREARLALSEGLASQGQFGEAAKETEGAYFLRFAPEPEPETLKRFYTLLRAGEGSTNAFESVVREAKSYDLTLALSEDEARAALQKLSPNIHTASRSPYVGLFAFQEKDADFFYGREEAAKDIIKRCQTSPHVVTVIGNSGAGKSSLVFAGVLPQLRQAGWLITTLRPGRQPFEALSQSLTDLLGTFEPENAAIENSKIENSELENATTENTEIENTEIENAGPEIFNLQPQTQELAKKLQEKSPEFSALVSSLLSQQSRQHLLIVVDQLEELFTISEETQDTARFLEVLLEAVQTLQGKLSLILTLRADFIGALLEYPPILLMLQETRYFLGSMTQDELRRAIQGPARQQGVTFETGLVQRILDDVSGQEGSLPLLEFALTQLWENQEKHILTHEAYDAVGGVEEALANHADQTFQNLSESEQRLAKKVFLQLVYPGTGQEDTRRIATREELGDAWIVVQKLASYPARLLVTGYSEIGEQTAEVSHEALIHRWGTLRSWMSDYRSFRTWQERLRQDVKLWNDEAHADTTLLRGFRLDEAKARMAQYGDLLGASERAFIEQSLDLRERETAEREAQRTLQLESLQKLASEETSRREAEEARGKLRTRALWLITLLGCVALGLAFFSYNARNQALTARNQATALLPKLLSSVALNSKNDLPQRSLLLALEAERVATESSSENNKERNDPNTANVQRVLRQLVSETGGVPLFHPDAVRATTFSPDSAWFITGSDDTKVRVWNVQTRTVAQVVETHRGNITTAKFSPDGTRLVTAGQDKTVQIWDAKNPKELTLIKRLESFSEPVSDATFSPDGRYLVSLGINPELRLWDTETWQEVTKWQLPGLNTWSVSFSPDGAWLAVSSSGDRGGYVSLWSQEELRSQGEPITLPLNALSKGLAFSQDSRYLALGTGDGLVNMWELSRVTVTNTEPSLTLAGHTDTVLDVALNDTWLASGSQDKTIRLWRLRDLEEKLENPETDIFSLVLRGHEDGVSNLNFSSDGTHLASGSYDNTARLWDLSVPGPDLTVLRAHGDGERRTDISPDGQYLASGNIDGTVRLRTLGDDAESSVVLGQHDSWVESITFSPDGTFLASASDASNGGEKVLELWTLGAGKATASTVVPVAAAQTIFDVAFNHDGTLLATAGADKTAQLWEINHLDKRPTLFSGHGDIVTDVALSPDSKYLATASFDGLVRVWDISKANQPFKTLEGHAGGVRTLAFSPDGLLLATAGQDSQVKVWNVTTWDVVKTLNAGSRVWAVAFSPNSKMLATANEDGSLGLWTGTTLELLGGHSDTAWSVSFSGDGKWLVSASEDKTVRFWPAQIESVRELACQKAGRNLTEAEWQDMFGETPYRATCPQFAVD